MPNRLLASIAAEDSPARPFAMTFSFSESMPASDWMPPESDLVHDSARSLAAGPRQNLDIPSLCNAWAETEPAAFSL